MQHWGEEERRRRGPNCSWWNCTKMCLFIFFHKMLSSFIFPKRIFVVPILYTTFPTCFFVTVLDFRCICFCKHMWHVYTYIYIYTYMMYLERNWPLFGSFWRGWPAAFYGSNSRTLWGQGQTKGRSSGNARGGSPQRLIGNFFNKRMMEKHSNLFFEVLGETWIKADVK